MKYLKIQSVIAILALCFSSTLFAQLTADQIAAIQAADSPVALEVAIQEMMANGATANDVAATLADSGQTPAAIATTLVNSGVPAAQATVAVRTAVPTASNAQLATGLANAGIDSTQAAAAISSAPAQSGPPAPVTTTVASLTVNSAGLMVDAATGRAIRVNSKEDVSSLVIAHVRNMVSQNPAGFETDTTLQNSLKTALTNAGFSSSSADSFINDSVAAASAPANMRNILLSGATNTLADDPGASQTLKDKVKETLDQISDS